MIEIYGYKGCHRCDMFVSYVKKEGFEYAFCTDVYKSDAMLVEAGFTYAPAIRYDGEWFTPEQFMATYE